MGYGSQEKSKIRANEKPCHGKDMKGFREARNNPSRSKIGKSGYLESPSHASNASVPMVPSGSVSESGYSISGPVVSIPIPIPTPTPRFPRVVQLGLSR